MSPQTVIKQVEDGNHIIVKNSRAEVDSQLIATFNIERVQIRLKEVLSHGQTQLEKVLTGPLQGLGKMLRPRLVLLSRGLLGPIEDLTIDVAVAVECIHNASIIHDDIIDGAVLRRGIPTVNHLY